MFTTKPSAFGKVPFRGDFVRFGDRAPELLEIDAWFQEGIHRAQQAAGANWNEVFDALPTLAFVFASRATDSRFCGVIRASRDRTGRRYPLVVGCRVDARACLIDDLPVALESFLRDTKAAVEDLTATQTEHFEARLEQLARDVDPSVAALSLQRALEAGTSLSLLATIGAQESRLEVMLSELRDLTVNPAKLALHFPVSGQAHEVAFWLGVVQRWLPEGSSPTLILWTPDASGSIRILYDRLLARYFEPMFWPGGDSDHEYDLMHTAPLRSTTVERAHASFGGLQLDRGSLLDIRRRLAEVKIG